MGLVTLFNGMDVIQTKDYIKITAETYINKIMPEYCNNAVNLRFAEFRAARATPLPPCPPFIRDFVGAVGDPDPKAQQILANKHGFKFQVSKCNRKSDLCHGHLLSRSVIRGGAWLSGKCLPGRHTLQCCATHAQIFIPHKVGWFVLLEALPKQTAPSGPDSFGQQQRTRPSAGWTPD